MKMIDVLDNLTRTRFETSFRVSAAFTFYFSVTKDKSYYDRFLLLVIEIESEKITQSMNMKIDDVDVFSNNQIRFFFAKATSF